MAKPTPAHHFLLLATLSLAAFVPLRTEAGLELIPFDDVAMLMGTLKSLGELFVERPLYKKLRVLVNEGKENYDFYMNGIRKIREAIGDRGNGTAHYVRIGNQKLPVLAVDVTNMFSWTTSCDFNSPGLWLISCNSALCERNADGPPYCATDDTPCDPSNTWGLFNASLDRYLETAAEPRQAQTPLWYFCTTSSEEGTGVPAAVLGLGRSGLPGTLPAAFTRFSYLLTSDGQTSVWLGDAVPEQARSTATTSTIPLISNPKHPELYYIPLKAIRVDGTELDLDHPGTGGVFMGSSPAQPWTYLNRAVYYNLVEKFKNLSSLAEPVPGPEPEQLCYMDSSLARASTPIPELALVFDNGTVMGLHKDNYWDQYINGSSLLQCLAILPSPWSTGESMLGSQLQWGWRMTYDLDNSVLHATLEAPAAAPPPHFAPTASAATRLRVLPLL